MQWKCRESSHLVEVLEKEIDDICVGELIFCEGVDVRCHHLELLLGVRAATSDCGIR